MTREPASGTRRPRAWLAFLALAVVAALLRVGAGGAPWVPYLDAAWGIACVAVLGLGAARHRAGGRVAWGLFAASVLCGAASMALYPAAQADAAVGVVRDALDLGAYLFGGGGIVILARGFGSADPDAWLDAAAVGVAMSVLLFEFVLEHTAGMVAAGRGTPFSLLVAAINAAIFTTLARFVIRPIPSPSLSLLGGIIAIVLILDTVYYATIGLERWQYEGAWFLAYGAWAASGIHPDSLRLTQARRSPPQAASGIIRESMGSIAIHAAGFGATMAAVANHVSTASGANGAVFAGAFIIQILVVVIRSTRLVRRLAVDERARQVAEVALRASEERFRRLAEVAPTGIFLADQDGQIVFTNAAWGRIHGLYGDDSLGTGVERAIHPDDREWVRASWLGSVRDHRSWETEHRVLRPDGSAAWVHATAAPLTGGDGAPSGWVGTITDITGLVAARTAAQEREAFISALIEQAPVGIEIYGVDGHSMSANRTQRELRARAAPDADRAADVRDDELMLRLGQREAILGAYAGRAGGDRRPVRIAATADAEHTRDLWVRLTWFPLRDPQGAVSAVISFLEDVSPGVRAEADRRAVEAKLRETAKLEALGVLAGGIAHDFNNLLVAILGHASMARSEAPAGSALDDDLASVETAARRAADLARQMLAYSGRGSLRVGAVSVEGLLREMGDLLARSISKGATLRHEFAPDLPPVLADATQLRQVALNLIVNASDALDGEPGTITLRTALVAIESDEPDIVPGIPVVPGQYVLLEVADTGQGMDEATRMRIFDPFFTTKAAGRGLGLAATLGTIKGHGGLIRVRSTPGRGTTVGVLLQPAAATADRAEGVRPAPGGLPAGSVATAVAETRAERNGHAGRILIVDDEPTVRTLGRRVLEQAGYSVTEAADGPEGIEAFAADPDGWSGVLLDLTLPTLDGMAVLAEIRRRRPDIPAVICSGWAAEEVAERLATTDGTVVLEKPYAPSALVEAFRASLVGREIEPISG